MRRAARVDANQPEIVEALRRVGATVQPLHQVGGGCPDLLIGFRNQNFLMEVKDGNKRPSEQRMSEAQHEWHRVWMGQKTIVRNVREALTVIGCADRLNQEGWEK